MIANRLAAITDKPDNKTHRRSPKSTADELGARRERRPVVLVIDDEAPNLKLAKIVLESEGFEVRLATDAISALEVLKTCDPDVIVTDIQLPGMDGWELTRRLRHNLATSHIPIIALTAYGTKGDAERAKEAGCVAYFAKPVSTRDLPDIIRKYLPQDRG